MPRVPHASRLWQAGLRVNDRPYIVPIYFSFDADRLYCFSTLGQKILWRRQNPLVCVEADEIRDHDDWESIVLLGRYVEISSGPEGDKARSHIRSLLKRPLWWQSGYTIGQVRRQSNAVAAIYYRMRMVDRTAIPLPSGVPTVKILWPLTWGLKPSGDSAPIELISTSRISTRDRRVRYKYK